MTKKIHISVFHGHNRETLVTATEIEALIPLLKKHFTPQDCLLLELDSKTDLPSIALRGVFPRSFVYSAKDVSETFKRQFTTTYYKLDPYKLELKRLEPVSVSPARSCSIRRKPRVLLVPSNGTGLGHVSRVLAVASCAQNWADVTCLSFSAAVTPFIGKGIETVHLASPEYLGLTADKACAYVSNHTKAILAHTKPDVVVYDGNYPYPALIKNAHDKGAKFVWIRRGMWPQTVKKSFMALQALCDAVIEPGDFAQADDTGPTWLEKDSFFPAAQHERTAPVLPVTKQLPAAAARAALNLPAHKKLILVMVGSGAMVNMNETRCNVISFINSKPDHTAVLAHWPVSAEPAPQFENAIVLEQYNLWPYLKAFDACVSTCGYNAFHELLTSGIPTLFLPLSNSLLDTQDTRARWAARHQLALYMPEHSLAEQLKALLTFKPAPTPLPATNGAEMISQFIKHLVVGTAD